MKKFEYSITGNDVVPQNMIEDIFFGTPCVVGVSDNKKQINKLL
jgi:hypothetical protein